MDEHDNFRRIYAERSGLMVNLRHMGAVDLDIVRGAGFNAKPKVIRKGHTGAGSGIYIGEGYCEDNYARSKRSH